MLRFLFCFLLICFQVMHGVVGVEDCQEKTCSSAGPAVRFPFRLKDRQPDYCGFPGFDLSCNKYKQTVLQLSSSSELYVTAINYTSQEIGTDLGVFACFASEIFYQGSSSPFKFGGNASLFSCPPSVERDQYTCMNIGCLARLSPCSSNYSGNQMYAALSYSKYGYCSLDGMPLVSCTKVDDYVLPPAAYILHQKQFDTPRLSVTILRWSIPSCKHCQDMGKECRLKKESRNQTNPKTECYDLPRPKGFKLGGSALKILGSCVLSIVVLVLGTIIFYVYRSKKREEENQLRIKRFLDEYQALKPSRYSYADIKRITDRFKEKLGQGAYGTVYKGMLSSELLVAVKMLNNSNEKGEDFINEVGTMGQIHHVNVVRLVGYCADGFIRALVYEFLPNGPLQNFLSSADNENAFLGWDKLHDIALGIAKGIEYLHEGCEQQILHFDIKPHNVLLDHDFTPKVADFGLAKLCSKDQSAVSMTAARGTVGYIAPEVFSRNFGNVSYKSDVYSFGTLLLEMVGGRKNFKVMDDSTSQVYFPEWIYNLLEQGDDLRLRIHIGDEGNAKIARKLAIVGLWCIQWHPIDRPSMKTVVQMLEREGDNITLPPNPFASTLSSS